MVKGNGNTMIELSDVIDRNIHSNVPNDLVENELHRAVREGNHDEIENLLCRDNAEELLKTRDQNGFKPFHRAVEKGDFECIKLFLEAKDHRANLASKFKTNSKTYTVIEYIVNNLPRPVDFLQEVFDEQITCEQEPNKNSIAKVTLDFELLSPAHKKDNQLQVLTALVHAFTNHDASILLHPLIESFMYRKWQEFKNFYRLMVFLYAVFVFVMSWMILRTYNPTPEWTSTWLTAVLSIIILLMILLEISLFIMIIIQHSLSTCIRKPVWLLGLCSKVLMIVIMCVQHVGHSSDWPKVITATAALLAWFEIMILVSHFPECDSMYHMFTIVVSRALKVFFFFGIFIIIGFSLAFWVIFHGTNTFTSFPDTIVRTIVMTTEFDFNDLYQPLQQSPSFLIFRIFFVVFMFFVTIVMMNLILGLIISDIKELQTEGRIENTKNLIMLIDTISTVKYTLMRKKGEFERVGQIYIYPGKSFAEVDHTIPRTLERSILEKISCTKQRTYFV